MNPVVAGLLPERLITTRNHKDCPDQKQPPVEATLASPVLGPILPCEMYAVFESTTPCGRRLRRPYNSRFSRSRLILYCLISVLTFLVIYRVLVYARCRCDSRAESN
jgi:hypothetical protein